MNAMRLSKLAVSIALVSTSCGARSDLLDVRSDRRDGGLPEAGAPDVLADAPGWDSQTDATLPTCELASAGSPVEIMRGDGDIWTPSLVVVEPGGSATPARLAVAAVARASSEIQVGFPTVGPAWPDVVSGSLLTVGSDTFSYPQIARSVDGDDQLAVTWLGGPGSLAVRWAPISLPDLTSTPAYSLDVEGSTPVDLCAGRVVIGSTEAPGFAIATQVGMGGNPPAQQQPIVTLLDGKGTLVQAVPLIAPVDYPASDPSLLWSGSAFLVASAHRSCDPFDPQCAENAITISRLQDDPENGLTFAPPTVVQPTEGRVPRRPAMAMLDHVFIAWFESAEDDPDAPMIARVKWLDLLGGDTLDLEAVVTEEAKPLESLIGLTATPSGLLLSWAEDGDPALPDGAPGRSRLVVRRVITHFENISPWLDVVEEPVYIDMTLYRSRAAPVGASLPSLDAAVFAWSGWNGELGYDSVYLGRVDCLW